MASDAGGAGGGAKKKLNQVLVQGAKKVVTPLPQKQLIPKWSPMRGTQGVPGGGKPMYSMAPRANQGLAPRPNQDLGSALKYLWSALTKPIPQVNPSVNPSAPYANQFIDLANKSGVLPIVYNATSNPAIFGNAWSQLSAPTYVPKK